MLGSKKSVFGGAADTTLVSRETVVVGDIHFSGNLEIEGLVQGNIIARPDADAVVRVVDKGRVEGEIRAPNVIVNGAVEGDVHSTQHLELAAKGRVQGNVYYNTVEMSAGSEVNGSLTHLEESVAPPMQAANSAASAEEAGEAVPAKVDRITRN
jgi:cytoskeletal protein CcmA (bactofilin family)